MSDRADVDTGKLRITPGQASWMRKSRNYGALNSIGRSWWAAVRYSIRQARKAYRSHRLAVREDVAYQAQCREMWGDQWNAK